MARTVIGSVVGFAVVALALWGIEALWPEQRQPKWRRGSFSDLLYLLLDIGLRRVSGIVVIIIAIGFIVTHTARPSFGAQQPLWLQSIEALVGGDILGYWLHRMFHKTSLLWPFHAVHHSAPVLDWVAASRQHPVDNLVHKVLTILPFFVVGFSPGVLAAYAPFLSLYPIVLHANVRWGFGPLRWLIASPSWHRWHHAAEAEALDRNFAGLFPWIDLVFGTAYFPKRAPVRFGLADGPEPRGMLRQMAYPFQRRVRTEDLPAAA